MDNLLGARHSLKKQMRTAREGVEMDSATGSASSTSTQTQTKQGAWPSSGYAQRLFLSPATSCYFLVYISK